MGSMQLPQDFKDFLKLLNDHEVEYLLLGGYAVAYHGFPRTTLGMDIWIANTIENAEKMIRVMRAFGFTGAISPQLFRTNDSVVRMGVPPMKVEIMTHASGVSFGECFQRKVVAIVGLLSFVFAYKEDDPPGGDSSSLFLLWMLVATPAFAG